MNLQIISPGLLLKPTKLDKKQIKVLSYVMRSVYCRFLPQIAKEALKLQQFEMEIDTRSPL